MGLSKNPYWGVPSGTEGKITTEKYPRDVTSSKIAEGETCYTLLILHGRIQQSALLHRKFDYSTHTAAAAITIAPATPAFTVDAEPVERGEDGDAVDDA